MDWSSVGSVLKMGKTLKQNRNSSSAGMQSISRATWNKVFTPPCFKHWIMYGHPSKCLNCHLVDECTNQAIHQVHKAMEMAPAQYAEMFPMESLTDKQSKKKRSGHTDGRK
jgi:hypothetical protein